MRHCKREAVSLDDCLAGDTGMDGGQTAQFILLAKCFLLGGVFGVLYDCLRSLRRAMRLKIGGTAVCDLVFCTVFLFSLFSFCINIGIGQNRAYILAGVAIGWIAYAIMLGKIANFVFYNTFLFVSKVFGAIRKNIVRLGCAILRGSKKLVGEKKLLKFKKNTSIFARKGLK